MIGKVGSICVKAKVLEKWSPPAGGSEAALAQVGTIYSVMIILKKLYTEMDPTLPRSCTATL